MVNKKVRNLSAFSFPPEKKEVLDSRIFLNGWIFNLFTLDEPSSHDLSFGIGLVGRCHLVLDLWMDFTYCFSPVRSGYLPRRILF